LRLYIIIPKNANKIKSGICYTDRFIAQKLPARPLITDNPSVLLLLYKN